MRYLQLLLVTLFIILFIENNLFAQVEYSIRLDDDGETYSTYMKSSQTYTGNTAIVATAQMTILVPHYLGTDKFQLIKPSNNQSGIDNFQPNMIWSPSTRVDAPVENSEFDYISFGFINNVLDPTNQALFDIVANVEYKLFSFKNGGECLGELFIIENSVDDFIPPNSENTNPENSISIGGAGGDAYTSNYYSGPTGCKLGIDASDDYNNTPFNAVVSGDASTNDVDAIIFSLEGTNGGMDNANGIVVMNPDGTYTFTPAPDFSGETSFDYRVCDNDVPQTCDVATVYIKVLQEISALGQSIVANLDVNTVEENQVVTGNILANDLDPDGGLISISIPSTSIPVSGIDETGNPVANAGLMSLDVNGNYTFTPSTGFTGIVEYPYETCNNEPIPDCDNSFLQIKVVSDLGNTTFANDDALITDKGILTTGNLLTNDFDSESDNQEITSFMYDDNGDGKSNAIANVNVTTQISGIDKDGNVVANAGTIIIDENGNYSFQPNTTFSGNAMLTYITCDDNDPRACNEATMVITVLDVNRDYSDAPGNYPVAWHISISDSDSDKVLDGSANVWLGDNTDFEFISNTNDFATGDSYDDAITFGNQIGQFPDITIPGQTYQVDVTLGSSADQEVFFGMWIDWDDDGSYDDFYSGSQITSGSVGSSTVMVTVPASLPSTGAAKVNIRLRADDSDLSIDDYRGPKINGEVEDFQRTTSLPVELLDFSGYADECSNLLKWSTASEENNSHFIVEYSKDGELFIPIGYEIDGAGTTLEITNYQFTHKDVTRTHNYYRLKQIDFDGAFEYSDVIYIKSDCNEIEGNPVLIYPNPTSSIINLEFYSEKSNELETDIIIIDALGQSIYENTISIGQGVSTHSVDLEKYPSGVYKVLIKNGHKISTYPISLIQD